MIRALSVRVACSMLEIFQLARPDMLAGGLVSSCEGATQTERVDSWTLASL